MTISPEFIPGRELSRQLSAIIEPRLRAQFPDMPLTLALIGPGSDVPGYDTARSMDHDWGPRLTIIVPEDVRIDAARHIDEAVDQLIPATISGFPTRFSFHDDGTMRSDPEGSAHRLTVTSVQEILKSILLIDSLHELSEAVWLSTPMQSLLELTSGDVFVDDSREVTAMRQALDFYPDHIWRYQLAGLWKRVAQVQPFIGRTGEVGDDVGSATIMASVARDLMRVGLLQSRQYAPYSKWLGTAFSQIDSGGEITGYLKSAMASSSWNAREAGINAAGTLLIGRLNALNVIPKVSALPEQFHSRPFHVLPAERIAESLRASLTDSGLTKLQATIGGIDVITDSTDALGSHEFRLACRAMFTR